MSKRFFVKTDLGTNRKTYHVADTAHRLLTNLGVKLLPGERASFKKTYYVRNQSPFQYKQITKADFEAAQMAVQVAAVEPQLPKPTVFSSVKPLPVAIPPAGRRSHSLFGVQRVAFTR